MEEKKLTDEEVIKAWECHINGLVCDKQCPYKVKGISCLNGRHARDTIDLIHRLQDENERQRKEIDILTKVYASSKRKQTKKSLLETIDKQKAEIERLTKDLNLALDIKETISGIGEKTSNLLSENENLLKENAELQKQVDELKEENAQLSEMADYDKGHKEGYEHGEKTTAKEIYELLEKWVWQLKNEKGGLGKFRFAIETVMQEIKEKYSLEVANFKLVELKKGERK